MRLFRLFGIDLVIQSDFWFLVALLGFSLPSSFVKLVPTATYSVVLAATVLSIALLAASIWAHEMCHSLVAKSFGIGVRKISLFMFGGCAHIDGFPDRPRDEATMAIVGPLSSLVIAVLCSQVVPTTWLDSSGFFPWVLKRFILFNIALGLFNLLPLYPMDGGRILHSVIWKLKGLKAAELSASYSGIALSVVFMVFGLYNVMFDGDFGGLWTVGIGLFLCSMSYKGLKAVKAGYRAG